MGFSHSQDSGGPPNWGGHIYRDLPGDRVVSECGQHEMEHHYAFYERMWEVHREATRRLLEGIWQALVLDWKTLDFNRHGRSGGSVGALFIVLATAAAGPTTFEPFARSFVPCLASSRGMRYNGTCVD